MTDNLGVGTLPPDADEIMQRIDPMDQAPKVDDQDPARLVKGRPMFMFPDGTSVELNGIPPLLLTGVQSDVGRPAAPYRTLKMAGGAVSKVARRDNERVFSEEEIALMDDPDRQAEERAYREYRAQLAQWSINSETKLARLLILMGVKDFPPEDEMSVWRAIGFNDPYEIKFNWLASKLWTEDDVTSFFEAISSITIPTQEGLDKAEDMFQSAMEKRAGAMEGSGRVQSPSRGKGEKQS